MNTEPRPAPASPPAAHTVLLVDDEPQALKWFARQYGDEFEVLTIVDSPTRPPSDDDQLAEMTMGLIDETFFTTIDPGIGPEDEAEKRRSIVEGQIRTLLGYVYRLHRDGFAPARG